MGRESSCLVDHRAHAGRLHRGLQTLHTECADVFIYDVNNMLYGTLFMLCGAYTLAQAGHVRGDFLYGSFRPRTQAALDLTLYIAFFLPGIAALLYAGWATRRLVSNQ
jgi:TRAP-type mannitol/chloroaromatic compound transport system permease small subunit